MSEFLQGIIKNLEQINQNPSSEGCLEGVIEMFEKAKDKMEEIERKTNPKKIHASIRNKRTRLYLQKIPEWLFSIKDVGEYHGINIKRWRMRNWDKFILHSNSHESFSGLINIEVCNSSLIINYIPTQERGFIDLKELKTFQEIDQDQTRKKLIKLITKLEQLGFQFNKKQPILEIIKSADVLK